MTKDTRANELPWSYRLSLCDLLDSIETIVRIGLSKLTKLEKEHREASKVWARTLSESAEASMRVERYKAAFEKRLRGVMRTQDTRLVPALRPRFDC